MGADIRATFPNTQEAIIKKIHFLYRLAKIAANLLFKCLFGCFFHNKTG
ncbi:hypothetical protein GAGA_2916 [Paraglaciecola agarilytica NO2]|uniref:Transposase n=1 Tax=Paraglaciecola agarilytica NO2 TaxID=1125747 RepID=A0ABQ0I8Z4_9ALTE|nr:hypothetical protein GAGA_2916 [Paraglaciecola agarilytica NO2]